MHVATRVSGQPKLELELELEQDPEWVQGLGRGIGPGQAGTAMHSTPLRRLAENGNEAWPRVLHRSRTGRA